ncbi:DUF1826 domain-containing protein [Hoeflea sp.]|uniref:DUF1826 domain-containing protein n=1 Tax=Hoeflea sp. TaxID=1940281 RepID=UPI003B024788
MNQMLPGQNQDHALCEPPALLQQTAQDVLIGRQADILADVAAPGVGAAIWQRNRDAGFETWIDRLCAEQLPALRTTVSVHLAEEAVQAACDVAKLPQGPQRNMLAGDVGALALIFGQVMETGSVQIRLDVSDGVMCPQFHLDNVRARLLCTYRGPGTEYVPEVHRDDPRQVRAMNTGSVGLFRGAQWDSDVRSAILHRSPGVRQGSGARLLLVIDTAA